MAYRYTSTSLEFIVFRVPFESETVSPNPENLDPNASSTGNDEIEWDLLSRAVRRNPREYMEYMGIGKCRIS